MANGYETEEEQIEAIRRWWHDNGRSVIVGAVVALVAVVGWQQWQGYQRSQSLAAAESYQEVLGAIQDDELDAAAEKAQQLRTDYANSVQTALADLRLGGAYAAADDYDSAASALRHASKASGHEAIERLATLRLAKALDAQGEREAALEQIQPVPEGPFAVRYHELVGDIQASRDNSEAAVAAYRAAIAAGPDARRRGLIQLKLADLGVEAEPSS